MDNDDDVKVYEDKCSVTYETAYEEQCRTEQEQVSQDDNGDVLFVLLMMALVMRTATMVMMI